LTILFPQCTSKYNFFITSPKPAFPRLTCIPIVVLCVCASCAFVAVSFQEFLELLGRPIELFAEAKGHGGAFGVHRLIRIHRLRGIAITIAVAIVVAST